MPSWCAGVHDDATCGRTPGNRLFGPCNDIFFFQSFDQKLARVELEHVQRGRDVCKLLNADVGRGYIARQMRNFQLTRFDSRWA